MYEDVKARSRAVWSMGDYAPASHQLEPAAAALVQTLGITSGMTVLDVAAGHGNCAVAAARAGATVVATDFSPTMLERGSRRTRAAGLDVTWQEADAAALPFQDSSFDIVTSTFGAIFAPEHDRVASEFVRVLRPGGLAGLTAWTPDGLTAKLISITREYAATPHPAVADSLRWGEPQAVAELFATVDCEVRTRRRSLTFRYDDWDHWRRDSGAHGLAVVARQTLGDEKYEEMRSRTQAVTAEHAYGEGGGVAFDSDYLEIIVRKPC